MLVGLEEMLDGWRGGELGAQKADQDSRISNSMSLHNITGADTIFAQSSVCLAFYMVEMRVEMCV